MLKDRTIEQMISHVDQLFSMANSIETLYLLRKYNVLDSNLYKATYSNFKQKRRFIAITYANGVQDILNRLDAIGETLGKPNEEMKAYFKQLKDLNTIERLFI